MVKKVALLLLAPLVVGAGPPDGWRLPVDPPHGSVVNAFDPPRERWSAGHRGVDLLAADGAVIRAAAAGVVTYAGALAGRGVVVVTHGRLRSTYEPVTAEVAVGAYVAAGDVLGRLESAGSHCAPAPCLHWGVKAGATYRDPMALIARAGGDVRLLPLGDRALTGDPPPISPPPISPPLVPGSPVTYVAPGRLSLPVAVPHVTSPFGVRRHPVTGIVKLHDGTDFYAPCGSPIRAAGAGTVSFAGSAGAYGLQVTIDHGAHNGDSLATSYSHLSRLGVTPGQQVFAGQTLGLAGTTGLSTGCHLHFMVYVNGTPTDPALWLAL